MKKLLVLTLCVALVGTLAVNGTFASAFDSLFKVVESLGVNGTPTTGEALQVQNVYLMRNDSRDALVEIGSHTQQLVPAIYAGQSFPGQTVSTRIGGQAYQLWDDAAVQGVVDKFIQVKNLGSSAAYVCVAIACPASEYLHVNLETVSGYVWDEDWRSIQIGGKEYRMKLAIYEKPLAANTSTPVIPLQFALDKQVTNQAITALGGQIDVQVQTMAVEVAAFAGSELSTPQAALTAALGIDATFNPFE